MRLAKTNIILAILMMASLVFADYTTTYMGTWAKAIIHPATAITIIKDYFYAQTPPNVIDLKYYTNGLMTSSTRITIGNMPWMIGCSGEATIIINPSDIVTVVEAPLDVTVTDVVVDKTINIEATTAITLPSVFKVLALPTEAYAYYETTEYIPSNYVTETPTEEYVTTYIYKATVIPASTIYCGASNPWYTEYDVYDVGTTTITKINYYTAVGFSQPLVIQSLYLDYGTPGYDYSTEYTDPSSFPATAFPLVLTEEHMTVTTHYYYINYNYVGDTASSVTSFIDLSTSASTSTTEGTTTTSTTLIGGVLRLPSVTLLAPIVVTIAGALGMKKKE